MIRADSQVPFELDFAVLDRSRLDHLYGQHAGDEKFICTLIDLFLAETPRRIEELKAARARSDLRAMANLVHTVQGAAANLGARALEHHCLRLDEMTQAGRMGEIDILIGGLDEELARLASALDKQKQKASLENPHR